MEIKDFITGKVTYDEHGQYFWVVDPKGGMQMLGELRGWGHIQNMFNDDQGAAGAFQDQLGQFVADAINEKMEREEVARIAKLQETHDWLMEIPRVHELSIRIDDEMLQHILKEKDHPLHPYLKEIQINP